MLDNVALGFFYIYVYVYQTKKNIIALMRWDVAPTCMWAFSNMNYLLTCWFIYCVHRNNIKEI